MGIYIKEDEKMWDIEGEENWLFRYLMVEEKYNRPADKIFTQSHFINIESKREFVIPT